MTTSTFPAKEKLFRARPKKFQDRIIRQGVDQLLAQLDNANSRRTSPKKQRRKAVVKAATK